MKARNLLLLGAFTLVSTAASAQSFTAKWERPDAPEFTSWAMEKTVYLWNVGRKGFYINHQGSTEAPYYGTHASVNLDKGVEVVFTRTNPDAKTTENWTQEGVTDYTCLLVSYVTKFSSNHCSFYTNADDVWTDNNTQANRYWTVVPQSGNLIKITGSTLNEVEKNETFSSTGLYLGAPANEDLITEFGYLVCFDSETSVNYSESGFDTDWACVTPEAYKKFFFYQEAEKLRAAIEAAEGKGVLTASMAKDYAVYNNLSSTQEDFDAAIERVKARVSLWESIDYATTQGLSESDLSEYQQVLDDPNADTEQLNTASAAAYDKGRWLEIAPYFEDINQGKKNDVSGVFVDPTFSTAQNNVIPSGWDITWKLHTDECSNLGGRVATYTNGEVTINNFIEAWKENTAPNYLGDGSITQTVPSLPAGVYMLAVDCIANNQGYKADESNPDGIPDDVELFAKASLDGKEYKTNLGTKNNLPEHFEFTFIHTGGSMTLGLRVVNSAEAKMPANWIAMDNLQLFYFGESIGNPDADILAAFVQNALDQYSVDGEGEGEPVEDLETTASYKQAYIDAIAAAQAAIAKASSDTDYDSFKEPITTAIANLQAGVAAYEKLIVASEGWTEKNNNYGEILVNTNEGSVWIDFTINEMSVDEIAESWGEEAAAPYEGLVSVSELLSDFPYTPEEIDTYIAKIDELYALAFAASLTPGTDCTSLLVNASFAQGFTGWTNARGTAGGLTAYPDVEVYDGAVDCYQIVKNVPAGVYKLECQAFERTPGGPQASDADKLGVVVLYMKDETKPENYYTTRVQDIKASAIPESEAVDLENCFISGGNPPEGFVNTGGTTNKDLTVTITVKNDEGQDEEVTAYVPDGMSGASYAFRAGRYKQEALGLIEGGTMKIGLTSNGVKAHWVLWSQFKLTYMGADASSIMLEDQIAKAEAYQEQVQEGMTEAGKEALQTAINTAKQTLTSGTAEEVTAQIPALKAAQEAAAENVAAVTEFNSTKTAFDAANTDAAPAAGKATAAELASAIANAMQMGTSDLNALTERMKAAILKLASDGNPVALSVIVNPSFEDGLNGWTYAEGTKDTQAADNSNSTYTMSNIDGTHLFNTWSDKAPAGGFFVKQTLAELPAGTYKLTAVGGSDANNNISLTANGETTAQPIITTDKGTGIASEFVFTLSEAKAIEIGATCPGWFKVDNFKLFYYGTESELTPTGIDDLDAQSAAATKNRKVFENGRIVIYKDGKKYNVAGQAIQ